MPKRKSIENEKSSEKIPKLVELPLVNGNIDEVKVVVVNNNQSESVTKNDYKNEIAGCSKNIGDHYAFNFWNKVENSSAQTKLNESDFVKINQLSDGKKYVLLFWFIFT